MSNVYQIITDRIVSLLSKGTIPWHRPWRTEVPKNLVSGKAYRGVNTLLLGSSPYPSPYWLTFNQAKSLKGSVKKGERGTPVIFWKVSEDEKDDGKKSKDFMLRYYTVFNVMQCDGIAIPKLEAPKKVEPIAACEEVIASYFMPPRIEYGGNRAFYSPAEDRVVVPNREQFSSVEEFYSTVFHELAHSTGAQHRLGRKAVLDHGGFASHGYSFEELVAEVASSFLAAEAGIDMNHPQLAGYFFHKLIGQAAVEHSAALFLDPVGQVTGCGIISVGDLASVQILAREVLKGSILANANSVIVSHNHPSPSSSKPSAADIRVTRRLIRAGEIVGVHVLDHIIVTPSDKDFTSMREAGHLGLWWPDMGEPAGPSAISEPQSTAPNSSKFSESCLPISTK